MENQIQPQPYWADFKIKVGLYAKQEENGETKRVLIDPKDIQFKFTYKDAKGNYNLIGKTIESPYKKTFNETFGVDEYYFANTAQFKQVVTITNKNLKEIKVDFFYQICK